MNEANEILKPHYSVLTDSVNEGMEDFNAFIKYENEKRYIPFNRRTKATLLNDYITNRVIINCNNKDGIKILSTGNNGFPVVIFNNNLVARVKKLNNELAPANIPTLITQAYNKQYSIEYFPENPTLVYFGYRVNSTISDIDGIYVVCRIDQQIQWYIDLTNEFKVEQTTIAETELLIEPPNSRVRVKPNIQIIKKLNTGTNN